MYNNRNNLVYYVQVHCTTPCQHEPRQLHLFSNSEYCITEKIGELSPVHISPHLLFISEAFSQTAGLPSALRVRPSAISANATRWALGGCHAYSHLSPCTTTLPSTGNNTTTPTVDDRSLRFHRISFHLDVNMDMLYKVDLLHIQYNINVMYIMTNKHTQKHLIQRRKSEILFVILNRWKMEKLTMMIWDFFKNTLAAVIHIMEVNWDCQA